MSIELPPYRPVKKRSGLKVMRAAFHALLMRELQTRFGEYRLGYLWAPLEVLMQVLVILVIFSAIRSRLVPGMDFSLFLVVGMVPFRMFQKIAQKGLTASESNKGLLIYGPLKHIDVVIARSFLEFIIYLFTCVLMFCGLAFFDIFISFSHLDVFLFCWVTLFLFSFGLALIMMVLGFYGGEFGRVTPIIFTFLYFTSGVIFPIHIVPEPYLSYLLYNPFVHNIELMRQSLEPNYHLLDIDFWYFLKCMMGTLFTGLLLYKATEKDMTRSR